MTVHRLRARSGLAYDYDDATGAVSTLEPALEANRERRTPWFGRSDRFLRRQVCEHEAAHAVAVRALGWSLASVSVSGADGDWAGETEYCAPADPYVASAGLDGRAVVSLAGPVWSELVDSAFPAHVCASTDLSHAARLTGDVQRARRFAAQLLAERRAEVLAIADRLEHSSTGRIVFDHDRRLAGTSSRCGRAPSTADEDD